MCIVAAKYLKNIGWTLVKNRDQDYVSDISFTDENDPHVKEIMCLYDHHSKYKEGMNYNGLTIITTSLTPILSLENDQKDGKIIHEALKLSTPKEVAKYITNNKVTGFIFIATKDELILIEAAKTNQGKGQYKFTQKFIPHNQTIVRTNHGIDLKWAGFQSNIDEKQDFYRKSSELRMKYAEQAVKSANTPEEMIDAFAKKMDNNLQLNLFRVENKPKQLRTIFQWVLVPSQHEVLIRPIQAKLNIKMDIEHINFKIIDNTPLKDIYPIKHFSKIIKKGNIIKTTILESFKTFGIKR